MNREPHLIHVRFADGNRRRFAAPSAAVARDEAAHYRRTPGVAEATTSREGRVAS
jgi:hypothetical protein